MFWDRFLPKKQLINVNNLNSRYYVIGKDIQELLSGKKNVYQRRRNAHRCFVIDFDGDIMATQSRALTFEVTSILCAAQDGDEVLVRLTSPGGAAHAYGYAASQLERIKKAGLPLTVAVDQVAASGGYMMACVADKIIAAPNAIIGSIGVVSEFPNFFRVLQKLGIDYKQYTVGKYKRTISPLGEITEEGEQKFQEHLEDIYQLFCEHVARHRQNLNLEQLATGDHWPGIRAKELGLVDELKTSEEFIIENLGKFDFAQISYVGDQKTFAEKLAANMADTILNKLMTVFQHFVVSRFLV